MHIYNFYRVIHEKKGTSKNPENGQKTNQHPGNKSKWKLRDLFVFVFMLCFLSFFGGPTIGPSVFTLIFWVCPFVALWFRPFIRLSVSPFVRFFRIFGCSLISHELLHKTYIYAHHQNELNQGIKMMCFIFRFSVYFSCNHQKCSQNGEDGNLKT